MAERKIVSIHEKGFVVSDDEGYCRVRVFNPTSSEITGEVRCSNFIGIPYNCCDLAPAMHQAIRLGAGSSSLPLGSSKNGIEPLCVLENFGTDDVINQYLRGKPKRMYATIPIYGSDVWLVSHIPGLLAWQATKTNKNVAEAMAETGCISVSLTPTPTPPNENPNPQPRIPPYTADDKNFDWRIVLALVFVVLILGFAAYKYSVK
jgi:hypothetical protein